MDSDDEPLAEGWRDPSRARTALVRIGALPAAAALAYDEIVPAPIDRDAATALLARWTPLRLDDLSRLEAAFGEAEVGAMLHRLRDQLDRAIDAPDTGAAHRLSGIAGMLGFVELAAAWRGVDEGGGPDAERRARIETRRAIAAIAKRLG